MLLCTSLLGRRALLLARGLSVLRLSVLQLAARLIARLARVGLLVVLRTLLPAQTAGSVLCRGALRRLAASALNVDYPDLALLTAVEATRLEQSPETYGALLTLLARQPDVVTRFRGLGIEPTGTAPDAFQAFIRDEVAKFARLAKTAGVEAK